jgi:hypothetical protein
MQTDKRMGEGRVDPKETIRKKARASSNVFPMQVATKKQSEEEYKIF